MFETTNTIEPATPQRARQKEPAIREATSAEMAALTRREEPVKATRSWLQRTSKAPIEPDAVSKTHGLYVAQKRDTRTYYADYQQKSEVMRADPARITSKLSDRQTVTAMLDLAQSRGWDKINLKGTDDFKREAWVQAQVRGIMTEGHKASDTDKQEVARRKQAAGPVEAVPKAAAAPIKVAVAPSSPSVAKEVKPTEAVKASPSKQTKAKANQIAANVWGNAEALGAKMRAMEANKQTASEKPKAAVTAS